MWSVVSVQYSASVFSHCPASNFEWRRPNFRWFDSKRWPQARAETTKRADFLESAHCSANNGREIQKGLSDLRAAGSTGRQQSRLREARVPKVRERFARSNVCLC